jgi:hypothetical protein
MIDALATIVKELRITRRQVRESRRLKDYRGAREMRRCADTYLKCARILKKTLAAPAEEVMVKEIQYPAPGGGMTLKLSHGVVPFMAAEFVKFFKESGGVNYVEFTLVDGKNPEFGPFTVTIQRMLGKTPGQLVSELREKVKELETRG